MKPKSTIFFISAALFGATALQAQVQSFDDFTGDTVGETLYDTTTNANNPIMTSGGGTWVTDDGVAQQPVFVDLGAGNTAIQVTKQGGTNENAFDTASIVQGIYSFDFNYIQDGFDSKNSVVKDAFTIAMGQDSILTATTNAQFGIDRSAQGLDLATWYNAEMIFNNGTAVLVYSENGGGSVAAGTFDLFVDGNLILDDQVFGSNAGNNVVPDTGFTFAGFKMFRSDTTDLIVQFDNFSVSTITGVNLPPAFASAVDLGGNWYWVENFGFFYYDGTSDFAYSLNFGWIYVDPAGTTAGVWFWVESTLTWYWTAESVLPWVYNLTLQVWINLNNPI
jgi:hypothetical protein